MFMEDLHLKGMTNGTTELQNSGPSFLLVIFSCSAFPESYFVRFPRGS